MNKKLVAWVILFFWATLVQANDKEILDNVDNSARSWLEIIDSGQYQQSWHQASVVLQKAKSESEWTKFIAGIRSSLGDRKERYMATAARTDSLPKLPDGEYIVLQYYTTFSKKGLAMETVSLIQNSPGLWQVANYEVK